MLKILLVFLIFTSFELRASYDAGRIAYDRGEYSHAYKLWLEVTRAKTGALNDSFEWTRPTDEHKRDAQYAIAVLYCLGKGVDQDYKQAAKWLKLAVSAGHIQAQLKLGFFYLQGKGVEKNEAEARQYFLTAAEHGFVDAQFNIGVMYLKGVGGKINTSKAKYWLKKAALQGDQDAFDELISLQQANRNKAMQTTNTENQTFEKTAVFKTLTQSGTRTIEDQNELQVKSSDALSNEKLVKFRIGEEKELQTDNSKHIAEIVDTPVKNHIKKTAYQEGLFLHEPAWLLKQKNKKYALQIVAMRSLEKLKHFTKDLSEDGNWAYFVKNKGVQNYYILLHCCFADKKAANKSKQSLSLKIKKLRPFAVPLKQVRPFVISSQRKSN